MICKKPFMAGNTAFGCGQCLPCRINRRRLWTWRMFYESQLHEDCCFVTLTYSPENVPSDGALVPTDLQLWLKRLRRSVAPTRFRYFAVGEYGDEGGRPHYHAILFGLGQCHSGSIDRAWGKGFVVVAEFNEYTAQYVAGYTVKKLTNKDDPRLAGKHPEFARMSNRPGIGADAMDILADTLASDSGVRELLVAGDVPTHLKIGKRVIPLGRYLRSKLRDKIGMPEEWNAEAKARYSAEEFAKLLLVYKSEGGGEGNSTFTLKDAFMKNAQQKIWNIEARDKLAASKRRKVL